MTFSVLNITLPCEKFCWSKLLFQMFYYCRTKIHKLLYRAKGYQYTQVSPWQHIHLFYFEGHLFGKLSTFPMVSNCASLYLSLSALFIHRNWVSILEIVRQKWRLKKLNSLLSRIDILTMLYPLVIRYIEIWFRSCIHQN